MRNILYLLITLCFIGIMGMAAWSYLPCNADQPQLTYPDESPDLVKKVNDGLFHLIKDDPATVYQLHKMIESSPYLKSQKNAFMEKYYGKSTITSRKYNERMLKLYLMSQMKSKTIKVQPNSEI